MSFIKVNGGFANLDKVILVGWRAAEAWEREEMDNEKAKIPGGKWPGYMETYALLFVTLEGQPAAFEVPWRETGAVLDALKGAR